MKIGPLLATNTNSKARKNFIPVIDINMTSVFSRTYISNRIFIIDRKCKNLNHITYFNYNKRITI